MSKLRNALAKTDFILFIICGMCIGIGGGILAGTFSLHDVGGALAVTVFVAYSVLVIALGALAMRTILKKRKKRIALLRAEGLLPDAAAQTDADVIRLANREMREEAALVYQEIHGGQLDAARFIVGHDRLGKTLIGFLLVVFLILIATDLYLSTKGNHRTVALNIGVIAALFSANFVVFNARAKRLRENREKLASGILPTPDSAFFRQTESFHWRSRKDR